MAKIALTFVFVILWLALDAAYSSRELPFILFIGGIFGMYGVAERMLDADTYTVENKDDPY